MKNANTEKPRRNSENRWEKEREIGCEWTNKTEIQTLPSEKKLETDTKTQHISKVERDNAEEKWCRAGKNLNNQPQIIKIDEMFELRIKFPKTSCVELKINENCQNRADDQNLTENFVKFCTAVYVKGANPQFTVTFMLKTEIRSSNSPQNKESCVRVCRWDFRRYERVSKILGKS